MKVSTLVGPDSCFGKLNDVYVVECEGGYSGRRVIIIAEIREQVIESGKVFGRDLFWSKE